MNSSTTDQQAEFLALLQTHVPSLEITADKATGQVPWREDKHPSLTANLEECIWYDQARKEGGGVKDFKARLGLNGASQTARRIVATYDYHDESGSLLYQVVRFDPKDFRQRQPDGNSDWRYNLSGVRRVLYRLPEILSSPAVYVVEGEKDADRLRSLGLPATCNSEGAGKWRDEYSQSLAGKRIVILPDNDQPGEQHAQQVARSLLPVVQAVKVVRLSDLPPKGDVSDWLDAGHTKEELTALVKATPILTRAEASSGSKSSGLVLTSLKDLFREPEEQVDYLVENLLPAGGFSLLAAKPKAGKSTLARNLALTVAQGKSFLGRDTQKSAVIYLALEEKRSEVKKHFKDMGATGDEEIYIFAAAAPVDALEQVRAVTEEKKPGLIIIDPLFRFTRVKDGNDYVQVTGALEPLLTLARETNAHVLCVHHTGKGERDSGDSILGSTAIFAAVDTALVMKRSDRYRTIQSIQRYGEDLPESVLRFDTETRTITLGESKEQEESNRIAEAIVEFLETKKTASEEPEILTEVEGRNAVKKRALRLLVEEKKVLREGAGKRGSPYLYALEKSWFSGTHPYTGYQGTRNEKADLTPQKDLPFSGTRDFQENGSSANSRVPEKCGFCGRPDCLLTAWGWLCRLSSEDRQSWQKSQAKEPVYEEEM